MSERVPVRVDNKGRITLPKKLRERADINTGDTLFVQDDGNELKITRALEHPLNTLRKHARKEYEEGRTVELREFARREGIPTNEEPE